LYDARKQVTFATKYLMDRIADNRDPVDMSHGAKTNRHIANVPAGVASAC
jgi:hypothetical protein